MMNDDFIQRYRRQVNTHSDLDIIAKHLAGELPDAQVSQAVLDKEKRLLMAKELRERYLTRLKVVPKLVENFKISESTARRDFDDACFLFGRTTFSSRDFYIDILIGWIRETRELAKKKSDAKSMATCDRNFKDLIRDFFGDNETPPFEDIQPPNIMIGFFPELLNVQLPDNWKQQVAALLAKKRGRDLDIQDADIVE